MKTLYRIAYLIIILIHIVAITIGKDTSQLTSFGALMFAYKAFEEICKRNDIERNKPKK